MAGRRLGQHFLKSHSILSRIAAAAAPVPDMRVLEIGPGKGALTEFLLARASRLIAIEVDPVLVHYLQQRFREPDRFTVINADVLKIDLAQWGPLAVAGNLPYYITSPILERVLALGPLLSHAVFLVQKEVALRVAAVPNTRDYGYLTVQVLTFAEPEILFDVPPGAFAPPPKVDSAVIRLVPRAQPLVADTAAFLTFASHCFRQKRKTLRNNLAPVYGKEAVDGLPQAGLRAEQLGIVQLVQLHNTLGSAPAAT